MSFFSTRLLQNLTISILILTLTVPIIGGAIAPGLDPSYIYAFNYFFANDIQIGKDISFSFGPLGFLLFPQAQGNNLLWATVIILLLKFIFIFSSLNLYKLIQIKMNAWNWIIATFAIYIASTMIDTHDLLIFIPLLLLIIHSLNNNLLLIVLASIIVSIALLTKSSAGIISLLLLSSYMIYLIYKRDYKNLLIIFISTAIVFIGIWFFLYQNLSGIFVYFYSMLELSKGNSSAMTINPENNWWAFTLFVLLFFSYPLIKREKAMILVYCISLLSSAAYFKYAISREDHINGFVTFLFLLLFVIFLVTKKERFKAIFHLSLIFISFLFVSPMISESYSNFKTYIHLPLQIPANIFDIKAKTNTLQTQSDINLKSFKLDNETRKMIGNNTVDTYPWDASYISANALNWKPRPTFQSYITYTAFLDRNNANFFKSKDAPEYIIWQLKHWGNETGSIDGRYLLNDEPSTLYEILNRYTVVSKNSEYLILKRNQEQLLSSSLISENTYQWNQWINIPIVSGDINSTFIVADTDIKRTIVQKLKKLIYKEFEVYIHYKFEDNSEQQYRLVVDTAQNGIWINPFLSKLFELNKTVVSIKLTHNQHDYFEDTFAIKWKVVSSKATLFLIKYLPQIDIKLQNFDAEVNFYIDEYSESNSSFSITGWAFEKQLKIDKATKYIVLKNLEKSFVYAVEEINRPDVTAYFKATNLNNSGFTGRILKKEITAGSYDIYILLIDENNNQHMINTGKKVII